MRSDWFPFGVAPEAELRLLCLPHAGAGASVYRSWGRDAAGGVQVCPIQPPGRERRRREAPLDSAEAIARLLAVEIAAGVPGPYALFGHSTGAITSFAVCRELRRIGGPMPVGLFVSGRIAPQLAMRRTPIGEMTLAQIAVLLREIGGTSKEILDDESTLARVRPLLVADFTVNQEYVHVTEDPLPVDITVFAATNDTSASGYGAAAWQEQTSARFALHELDGGHFAVFDHGALVHQKIAEATRR